MEAEARYTFVGAAILVLIAAVAAGLLWLQDAGSRRDFAFYNIFFEHQSLDGLQLGGEVAVRGIRVGRVEDIALTEAVNRVRVTVRVDRRIPVAQNTVAIITRNLITGIASINLVTPDKAGPPLVVIPEGSSWPVIAEGESDTDNLTGRFSQIGDLAAEAVSNFNRTFRAENREAMGEALRNLRDLTAGLNKRLVTLDQSMAAFNSAVTSAGRASDRIATAAERADKQLEPALAQAESAMRAMASAAQSLERETKGMSGAVDRAAEATDDQLTALAVELRSSVEAFNHALDRFRDPAAALLGPSKGQLGPGEK
jgi:phospholipid/cholesterol/gamma-HCH transport system substrate-binding protein